ncbi:hypothetical protein PR048_020143 [Dryococelus australis]|uniref:DDE Tnp4 domain-containing protein n=1 Tax=Dryococelus australis TaxID=614101 RepID=A0ABQ9H5K7_9NEOP|nr:hypothetical protein PR048_020143 [Dryococelus australis]
MLTIALLLMMWDRMVLTAILTPFLRTNLWMKRVYNYRICHARRMVQCGFGILDCPLYVHVQFADVIVIVCCLIHNFVRKNDSIRVEEESYECPLENINLA